jgi:hypothetical protein
LGTATSSQCETGSQTELPSTCETVGTQTDSDDKSFDSKGTQYKLETRSVGLTCKISPVKKSRYIQAVATTKNQGIGISVGTKDNGTQYDSKQNLVVKHDIGVWCGQSPGATARHVQTMATDLVSVKTNTAPVVVTNVGTVTDIIHPDWGDIMEKESVLSELSSKDPDSSFEMGELVSPSKLQSMQVDLEPTQSQPMEKIGLVGLESILKNLDISSTVLDQYVECTKNVWRNNYLKCLIECKTTGEQQEREDEVRYWAIFDDHGIFLTKTDSGIDVVRYVKLYGDYLGMMCKGEEDSEFVKIDESNTIFKQCENVATLEIHSILGRIRNNQGGQTFRGGHVGGYGERIRNHNSYGGYGGRIMHNGRTSRGGYGGAYGEQSRDHHSYGGYGGGIRDKQSDRSSRMGYGGGYGGLSSHRDNHRGYGSANVGRGHGYGGHGGYSGGYGGNRWKSNT